MGFRKIDAKDIAANPFSLISEDWMLITAGNADGYNTMTASWGALGFRWGKNVAHCLVRPHRHTYGFMENGDYYTLSFYDEKYRDALNICGSKSGRDIDKAAECGLTPLFADCGAVYFEEASLVLVCKKLYFADLLEDNFTDLPIDQMYRDKDFHREYIGEIIEVLQKN